MIIINARINSNSVLNGIEASQLSANIKTLGINEPITVFDFDSLTTILKENKGEEFVLFSNFPPNSSYSESATYGNKASGTNSWHADDYGISSFDFSKLNEQYKFNAIHFISGAPASWIDLEYLQAIFPDTKVTLKRNQDFIDSKLGFEKSYRNYIVGRIKESL